MSKTLYYTCPRCLKDWQADYEAEYGECDDDCPACGLRHISPVTKSRVSKEIKKKNKARLLRPLRKVIKKAISRDILHKICEDTADVVEDYIESNKNELSDDEGVILRALESEEYRGLVSKETDNIYYGLLKAIKKL
jgi:rubrerythrin